MAIDANSLLEQLLQREKALAEREAALAKREAAVAEREAKASQVESELRSAATQLGVPFPGSSMPKKSLPKTTGNIPQPDVNGKIKRGKPLRAEDVLPDVKKVAYKGPGTLLELLNDYKDVLHNGEISIITNLYNDNPKEFQAIEEWAKKTGWLETLMDMAEAYMPNTYEQSVNDYAYYKMNDVISDFIDEVKNNFIV